MQINESPKNTVTVLHVNVITARNYGPRGKVAFSIEG
jgi:hypothetical protein